MRVNSRGALLLLLTLSAPAIAAERRLFVSSFDRVRVEGAFPVTLTTGRSPGGGVTGDARALEGVEVRQDGGTLVVRPVLDHGPSRHRADTAPIAITLVTPRLTGATVIGGGALAIVGGKAERLDLAVTGAGSIALTAADTQAVTATVIGTGAITLSGRAGNGRLSVNGAGKISAEKLEVGELTVRVDGPGEVTARARYTASVTNAGLGKVSVAGNPKCMVKNSAGGPVTCGLLR